jgi:osmotically-inducible protein OsmY
LLQPIERYNFSAKSNPTSRMFAQGSRKIYSSKTNTLMKNQQERRNGNSDRNRDDFNSRQGNREQNSNRGSYDTGNRSYGGSRGNNSGYEDQDMNSTYGSQGRRENYGYGSQENNESYRNFSTQGRNSGLGNQGGYSSYGNSDRDYERGGNEEWNRNESDNNGERERGWRDYQGTEWNSGRSSYRPYSEDEYHPGSQMGNRGENRYNMGGSNSGQGQGFGTSYQDGSRGRQGWDSGSMGSMGRMGESSFGESGQSNKGKGPKGYQRSDERIEESVNDRLTDDHMLDASEIEVKVSKGEVILTGSVSSRDDKRRAEEIAEAVSGVSNVENRIRVSKNSERNQGESGTEAGSSKTRSESSGEKNKTKQTANGAHV